MDIAGFEEEGLADDLVGAGRLGGRAGRLEVEAVGCLVMGFDAVTVEGRGAGEALAEEGSAGDLDEPRERKGM